MQAFLSRSSRPIVTLDARVRGDLRPGRASCCGRATPSGCRELGDLLDRLGAEGPDFLYKGDVARA